jgi:3-oxoacyl-[acyl-carrier-protein] synthase-3
MVAERGIVAMGAYAPSANTVVFNETIAAQAGIKVQDIVRKTGIKERRYSPPGTPTSELAAHAVEDLRKRYPAALDKVGTLIVATSTKDQPIPHTAAFVHRKLGLPPMETFDVDAVCTGFIQALKVGVAMFDGSRERSDVLVVGADRYPAIVDPADGMTAAIFGEAAGAVVISAVPPGRGFLSIATRTHSELADLVRVEGGGTRHPLDAEEIAKGRDRFRMVGWNVRSFAFDELPSLVSAVLADAGVEIGQVKRVVPHQANVVLLGDIADRLGIPLSQVAITADKFGNTGCASIPFTLVQSHAQEPLLPGDVVLLISIGGGMTLGAAVFVWG